MGRDFRVEAWEDDDPTLFDIENVNTGDLPVMDGTAFEVVEFIERHPDDSFLFKDDIARTAPAAIEYMKEHHP